MRIITRVVNDLVVGFHHRFGEDNPCYYSILLRLCFILISNNEQVISEAALIGLGSELGSIEQRPPKF